MTIFYQERVEQLQKQLVKKCITELNKKDLTGFTGAKLIRNWFNKNTKHPHPLCTFQKMAMDRDMNRDNTNEFALTIAKEMATLVSINEMLLLEE